MKLRCLVLCLFLLGSGLSEAVAGEPKRSANGDATKHWRGQDLNRKLTSLKTQCERVLEMQLSAHNGIVSLRRSMDVGKKPLDPRATQAPARLQGDIAVETTKMLRMLEGESAAVAFPDAVRLLLKEMNEVQRRLQIGDLGTETLTIEQDIIETLRDFVSALSTRC